MLHSMERSTIYYLKQKGWTNVQIAEFTGHHRDTIARVLREAVDKQPKTRQRSSAVAVFDRQIQDWLDQNLPVIRMLELARADTEHPYAGGETAFYDYVRKVRRARKQTPRALALRFEGVPGEFLQIDWGEVRTCSSPRPAWVSKRATFSRPGSNTAATCSSVSSATCARRRGSAV